MTDPASTDAERLAEAATLLGYTCKPEDIEDPGLDVLPVADALAKRDATIARLTQERDTAIRRAEALEAELPQSGHGDPCVICGEPCSSLAGNPARWPVRLDNSGWRHIGCINKLLAEREALEAEVENLRAALRATGMLAEAEEAARDAALTEEKKP